MLCINEWTSTTSSFSNAVVYLNKNIAHVGGNSQGPRIDQPRPSRLRVEDAGQASAADSVMDEPHTLKIVSVRHRHADRV